jgi:uncharacterized protein YecT (DUF1311 family)
MLRFLFPALILLPMPLLAQDVDCANAMAQSDLNICAEQDWQEADADLNRTYQEVMATMKAIDADLPPALQGAETALRTAQRAWISYRDAHCSASGFRFRGGSAETLLIYGCLRQTTIDRTEELLELTEF